MRSTITSPVSMASCSVVRGLSSTLAESSVNHQGGASARGARALVVVRNPSSERARGNTPWNKEPTVPLTRDVLRYRLGDLELETVSRAGRLLIFCADEDRSRERIVLKFAFGEREARALPLNRLRVCCHRCRRHVILRIPLCVEKVAGPESGPKRIMRLSASRGDCDVALAPSPSDSFRARSSRRYRGDRWNVGARVSVPYQRGSLRTTSSDHRQ